ncbi:formin-binding protein [Saitoella coloradoensis]
MITNPAVTSFANAFWGREDKGVDVLLSRMSDGKQTCEELRTFYKERAAIEEDYAKRLSKLAKQPLGSRETGTLKESLDTVRSEIESMGVVHTAIGVQYRGELEDALTQFAGAIRERRKIIQNNIDKLHKLKLTQQKALTQAKEKYESDCMKVKGYLAQSNLLIGKELDKNQMKMEKVQASVQISEKEYQMAAKVLGETTDKWNREWKAACDKFQDLEEERIDFIKANLWTFANITSTVCVSDDESCEKIRVSLEKCNTANDIQGYIQTNGTGAEIPVAPRFQDFCASGPMPYDEAIEIANFSRGGDSTTNLAANAGRQPPRSRSMAQEEIQQMQQSSRDITPTPQQPTRSQSAAVRDSEVRPSPMRNSSIMSQHKVPVNDFPPDGITQFCRTDSVYSSPSTGRTAPGSPTPSSVYSHPTTISDGADPWGANQTVPRKPAPNAANRLSQYASQPPAGPVYPQSRAARKSFSEKRTSVPAAPNFGRHPTIPSGEEIDPKADVMLQIGDNTFELEKSRNTNMLDEKRRSHVVDRDSKNLDPIAAALAELKGTSSKTGRTAADRFYGLKSSNPSIASQSNNSAITEQSQALLRSMAVESAPLPAAIADTMGTPIDEKMGGLNFREATTPTPPPSYDNFNVSPTRKLVAPANGVSQRRDTLGAPPAAVTSQEMNDTRKYFSAKTTQMFDQRNDNRRSLPDMSGLSVGNRKSMGNLRQPEQPRSRSPAPDPRDAYARPPGDIRRAMSPGPGGRPQSGGMQMPPRSPSPRPQVHGDPAYGYRSTSPAPGAYRSSSPAPQNYRSASPAPPGAYPGTYRSTSPAPYAQGVYRSVSPAPMAQPGYRSASPNPQMGRSASPRPMTGGPGYDQQARYGRSASPRPDIPRALSPGPYRAGSTSPQKSSRPVSGNYAGISIDPRGSGYRSGPPQSHSYSAGLDQYTDGRDAAYGSGYRQTSKPVSSGPPMHDRRAPPNGQGTYPRSRSKSVVEPSRQGGQFTDDGQEIMGYVRALYDYKAAMAEEIGFNKNDVLMVLRKQPDGWWEGEVVEPTRKRERGLFPSNYCAPVR